MWRGYSPKTAKRARKNPQDDARKQQTKQNNKKSRCSSGINLAKMSVRAAVTSKNEPRKEERKNKYAENAKRQGDKGLCRKETGYITSEIFGVV